ncbi:MAG: hypothetical protein BroJett040_09060 [Oligoflexia bacterium]|nr:MAG: hypothetical protein BroJett040_09060 [Oligoflexia bacterium]
MNAKVLRAFAVFFVVLGHAAGAAAQTLSPRDQMIYQETRAICSRIHTQIDVYLNKNTLDALILSMGQSLSAISGHKTSGQAIRNFSQQNFISDYTWDRLQSAGFQAGIEACFPGDREMQSRFVLAMMTADNVGKVPSIVAAMYALKIGAGLFSKFSLAFPKAAMALKIASPVAMIVYSILDVRAQLSNAELTPEEAQRIQSLQESLRAGRESTKALALEIAQDEIAQQEQRLQESRDPLEKEKIRSHIERVKLAMAKL